MSSLSSRARIYLLISDKDQTTGSEIRANSTISTEPGSCPFIYPLGLFQCRDTFYPTYASNWTLTHTRLNQGGWKNFSSDNSLIINSDFPLLTRVMLALVQNKKSHLKPGRNKRRRVAKHFMSQKEHACAHKIVPRARNYDLNCTRTTLTAEHKSGDRCISCRQNTACEKLYLCVFTTIYDRK